MILTRDEMAAGVETVIEKIVKDFPEDQHAKIRAEILQAWSSYMFQNQKISDSGGIGGEE